MATLRRRPVPPSDVSDVNVPNLDESDDERVSLDGQHEGEEVRKSDYSY